MARTNDDVNSTLNNLIETCKDREEGYRTAAEGIVAPKFKTLFSSYARQSAQFAFELQREVLRLGGDPEKGGSLGGAMHRGWLNIKSVVTGGDESAIISECERGEDAAVKSYKDALDDDLPVDIRAIVERQYVPIKEGHDYMRTLEKGGDHDET